MERWPAACHQKWFTKRTHFKTRIYATITELSEHLPSETDNLFPVLSEKEKEAQLCWRTRSGYNVPVKCGISAAENLFDCSPKANCMFVPSKLSCDLITVKTVVN